MRVAGTTRTGLAPRAINAAVGQRLRVVARLRLLSVFLFDMAFRRQSSCGAADEVGP